MQHSNGRRKQLPRDNGNDKASSRQLTKESSAANTSSRILHYGGSTGSVPFPWESRPGTILLVLLHILLCTSAHSPSFLYRSKLVLSRTSDSGWRSKPKVRRAILSKLNLQPVSLRKSHHVSPPSSVSSSSSSSSSMWSLSSPSRLRRAAGRRTCPGRGFLSSSIWKTIR